MAKQQEKPNLLSIGNPVVGFDKKEFMPSVFARIYLSRRVVFFASNLVWLEKYKNKLKGASLDAYYYTSGSSSSKDVAAVSDIGAKELDLSFQRPTLFVNLGNED